MEPQPLPGFTVVLVAYNSGDVLRVCLQSLRAALKGFVHQVVVVDNASDPGALGTVSDDFPEAKWIFSPVNLGFGKACNLAVRHAEHPWLFFVNPDTVCDASTFEGTLRFHMARGDAGVVGCRILNGDGTLQLACRRSFPTSWSVIWHVLGLSALFPKSRVFGRYNLTWLDENEPAEVDAVSGSFFCVRKSLFEELKGFDEDFFMYGEDLDLCLRAQRAGFRNWYTPDARLVHLKGRSAATRRWKSLVNFHRAMGIFARKWPDLARVPLPLVRAGIAFDFSLAFLRSVPVGGACLAELLGCAAVAGLALLLGAPSAALLALALALAQVLLPAARSAGRFVLARRLPVAVVARAESDFARAPGLADGRFDVLGCVSREDAASWRRLPDLLRISERALLLPDREGWWTSEECRRVVAEHPGRWALWVADDPVVL